MTGKQETLIYIEQENKTEAEFMSRSFVTSDIKNRAYINALGAELILKYLSSEGVNVNNVHNLHSISKILEKIDISDIELPNIHIDVRVVFDENQIFIPKSHFEMDILPDIYAVLKLSKDFTYVEFLGYFAPKLINKKNQNKDYYFIEKEKLSSPNTFTKFVKDFAGMTSKSLSQDEILRGRELSIAMADHNITDEDQKELIYLLLQSDELRDSVLEFDNFETLSYSVGSSMEQSPVDNVIEAEIVSPQEEETNQAEEMLEDSELLENENTSEEDLAENDDSEQLTEETPAEDNIEEITSDNSEDLNNNEIELSTNTTEDIILDESFFNMEDDESTLETHELTNPEQNESSIEENTETDKDTSKIDASEYLLSLEDEEETKPSDNPEQDTKTENALGDVVKNTIEKTAEAATIAGAIAAESQVAGAAETVKNTISASKDAIKLAGVSGEIVRDLINKNLGKQEEHLDKIDYAKTKTNATEIPENISAYDLSSAKLEANIEAEQSGQFDSPTDLDSLQKVNTTPKGYNENIEQDIIDLGEMESVELGHVEENTDGIVDLNNLSQVDSPTKPVKNLEEKISTQDEDKGMDLPDLNSFTINDDGTSSLDNLDINFNNEQPHEENLIDFNMNSGEIVIENNESPIDIGNSSQVNPEEELVLDDDFAENLMSDEPENTTSQDDNSKEEEKDEEHAPLESDTSIEEPTLDDTSLPSLDMGDGLTLDENLTLGTDIVAEEPLLDVDNSIEDNSTSQENANTEQVLAEPISEINDTEDLTIEEPIAADDTLNDDLDTTNLTDVDSNTEDLISESNKDDETDMDDLNSLLSDLEANEPQNDLQEDDITEIQEDLPSVETPLDEELQTIEDDEHLEENNEQNQDWLEEPNYDDLQDVEPIQQDESEFINEPQSDDNSDTINDGEAVEELNDEDFIQEPPEEERHFNVVENSTVITDKEFSPREIEIDINNPEIQLQPEGPEQLEDLYDENSENTTMLQNPGRLTRGNPQNGKVGLGMGLGIVGVIISIIIVGIIGFSISKMVKKPSDEAPEPITDDAVPTSSDNGVNDANTLNVDQNNVVNMDSQVPTPVKKQQAATLPKTITQAPTQTKKSIPETSYIDVRKVSWEVPDYISYNANFRQYFQSAGKSLKLSLTSDLLLATDYAYSDQARVSILFDKDGTFKDAKILLSSGSAQIDNIVLQTVNQTLRVLKAPHSIGNDESTTVILKIYF